MSEDDCGTINGIDRQAIKDGEDIVEPLRDRIAGRFTLDRVRHPISGAVIVDFNEEITDELAEHIEQIGIETVRIRTVLTCESKRGVCRKCYGRNLASNRAVEIGEAVGIVAAQSIGQPGTQLTMKTFHIGGAATRVSEENRVYLPYPCVIREIHGNVVELDNGNRLFTRKGHLIVNRVLQQITLDSGDELMATEGQQVLAGDSLVGRNGDRIDATEIGYVHRIGDQVLITAQPRRVDIRNGSELMVGTEQIVPEDETMAYFDPFAEPIIAEVSGTVRFDDIVLGTTLREEINEDTGKIEKKITEFSAETLQPRLVVETEDGQEAVYYLPGSAYLNVSEGDEVKAGRTLAKLLKESVKTRDITGGLPRVGELFEARRPRNPAVLAKIDGIVYFRGITKGKRVLAVEDSFGDEHKHAVPMGKHLLVRDGDTVEAGEPLCEGQTDPHDVLAILGENALQAYLVNEIQEVYRLQGVRINDKHIGMIIRQMMKKVEIVSVGDTEFIFGQQVDRHRFRTENEKVIQEGGQPAVAQPMLLGITRASLNIDSFISAASFQETTRVLTNSAIAGSSDYLRGLKENVIIGNQIPAGTGIRAYRDVKLFDENMENLDVTVERILAQKRKEQEEREAQIRAEMMSEELGDLVSEVPTA